MKKSILFLIAIATFSSCTKCYECRIQQTTKVANGNGYTYTDDELTSNVEKCDVTAREIEIYEKTIEGTTTSVISGKTYTTTTVASCK